MALRPRLSIGFAFCDCWFNYTMMSKRLGIRSLFPFLRFMRQTKDPITNYLEHFGTTTRWGAFFSIHEVIPNGI